MTNNINLSIPSRQRSYACVSCRRPVDDQDPDCWHRVAPHDFPDFHESIEARRGNRNSHQTRFSSGSVIEQAADRYFHLISATQAQLKGRFATFDFNVLFDRIGQPSLWGYDIAYQLSNVIDDDDDVAPALYALVERIDNLDLLQLAAFVDACERVSRGYDNPLL